MEHSGKTIDSNNKLLKIDIPSASSEGYGEHLYFNDGDVREEITKIFEPNSQYSFIMTVANQKAVNAFKNKIVIGDKELYFRPAHMDTYLEALGRMAQDAFGKKNYVSYPLVHTEGIHSLDRSVQTLNNPTIHIIKDHQAHEFKDLVDKLNGDEAYKCIRKIESPQYYRMAEIRYLKDHGILPLKTLPRTWTVRGLQLKDAIDFLVQFNYESESRSYGDDD